MYKPEFQLGDDARLTLFKDPVDWRIVAEDLKRMHLRQRCSIIITPENLDSDQRVIKKYKTELYTALEGYVENYELSVDNRRGFNRLAVARII